MRWGGVSTMRVLGWFCSAGIIMDDVENRWILPAAGFPVGGKDNLAWAGMFVGRFFVCCNVGRYIAGADCDAKL
jgi:hypothetical protein